MSSLEFQQLSGAHAALIERVARVEAEVETLKGRVAKTPKRPRPKESYHVVGPEGTRGLWGVAEHLRIPTSQIPAWISKVKELNGFTDDNPVIHQGDQLRIP
jgi:hypothetical protein